MSRVLFRASCLTRAVVDPEFSFFLQYGMFMQPRQHHPHAHPVVSDRQGSTLGLQSVTLTLTRGGL